MIRVSRLWSGLLLAFLAWGCDRDGSGGKPQKPPAASSVPAQPASRAAATARVGAVVGPPTEHLELANQWFGVLEEVVPHLKAIGDEASARQHLPALMSLRKQLDDIRVRRRSLAACSDSERKEMDRLTMPRSKAVDRALKAQFERIMATPKVYGILRPFIYDPPLDQPSPLSDLIASIPKAAMPDSQGHWNDESRVNFERWALGLLGKAVEFTVPVAPEMNDSMAMDGSRTLGLESKGWELRAHGTVLPCEYAGIFYRLSSNRVQALKKCNAVHVVGRLELLKPAKMTGSAQSREWISIRIADEGIHVEPAGDIKTSP